MKKILPVLLPCLLLVFAAAASPLFNVSAQKRRRAAAAPARPDARVEQALKTLGYPFIMGDRAAFLVKVELDGGRSQIVEVESVGAREEYRSVHSEAMLAKTIPAAVRGRLARENAENGSEKWSVMNYRDAEVVVYLTVVEADCDDETLQDTIEEVAAEADAMEQALTGEDKL